ncbi:MAG: hypothetical protein EZS28_025390 [Streblomastix strix]|uniref:CCDC81 HU domain-containing protein n=1 Tax=Streblomastix strix TaxID=222440 RepID=A0A5J4V9B1_9EUKA|nr:MAG: hypothetical protein EZS28_025390 [Streblomastix strix]
MPVTKEIIAERASEIQVGPSASETLSVWEVVCSFLNNYVIQGKMFIPDFATFSFQVPKIEAANQGSFNKCKPIFKINAQFSAAHEVSGKSIVLDTDNVQPVLLYFSTVGAYCCVFREKASQYYRMFLQALGAAID